MKTVAVSFSDVTFVIVGDSLGIENLSLQDLKNEAKKIGLEGKVIFTGSRNDVPHILQSFDILVLPSSKEPFGRVVMEAMAMGVAVVATDSGGPGEIIEDGVCGIIIPPDDAFAIVQAVLELLRDAPRRKELGGKAQERVRRSFDLKNTVYRFNDIFEKLLDKKGEGH
jgi:glycosyltransferase involved in cell wall biosynthesis